MVSLEEGDQGGLELELEALAKLGGGAKGPTPPFDKLLISTLLKRGEVKCEVILKEK